MIRLENIKLPAKLKRTMASIKRAPVNLVSPSRNSADACAFFPLKSIRGSEPASGFRHSPLSAQRMCVVRQPEQSWAWPPLSFWALNLVDCLIAIFLPKPMYDKTHAKPPPPLLQSTPNCQELFVETHSGSSHFEQKKAVSVLLLRP